MAITPTPFDSAIDVALVAAQGAGTYIKVVAISMHNNESTESNDEIVRLTNGVGGTDVYGGSTGAIYLPGRGGVFQLSMSVTYPHFTMQEDTSLYMNIANGRQISGTVWWTTD